MIKTFADKRTADLYTNGTARWLPSDVVARAVRKLEYVDFATSLDDLRTPPGNRLHGLKGDRAGQHAIAVNDQWRVCFRFAEGDAYDVQVCYYH
jgi:proteic killer suppression protein